MSLTEQATRPKAISNKYRGKCTNCNTRVEADAGFVMKNDSGKWICYCSDCLPVKRGDPVAGMARVEERRQEVIAEQAAAEEAMLQKIAREKIEDKGASHIISAQEKGLLLELTAERIDVVKDAFSYMLSVCDGAKTRDDCGFNKPDSCMAHWCVTSTLEQTGEVALAYALMVKYPRQLRDKYPLLFTDKEN